MFFIDSVATVQVASPTTAIGTVVAGFADHTATTFAPGFFLSAFGAGSGGADIVPSPPSGSLRQVKYLGLSVSTGGPVIINIARSGLTPVMSASLSVGDTLTYDEHNGWQVILADGTLKTIVGPQGIQGIQGVPGANGNAWFTGSGAPNGVVNASFVGDLYLRTSTGDVYQASAPGPGGWGSPIENIKGPAGSVWFTGASTPGGVINAINAGDLYLNTSNGDVYQASAPGLTSWGSPIENIVGPSGTNGTNGTNGANGNVWLTGGSNPNGSITANFAGDMYLRTTTGDVYQASAPGLVSWGSPIENLTGANGSNGSNGTNGNLWFTGAGAPLAPGTNAGDLYLNTSNGDVYQWSGSSWGSPIENLTGANGSNGSNGTNGNLWFTGAGAPSVSAVTAGDMYLNTSNGDVYQASAPGPLSWGSPIENLTGPAGSTPTVPGTLGQLMYNNGSAALAADSATTDGVGNLTMNSINASTVLGTTLNITGKLADGTYPISTSLGGSIVITNGVITAINPAA